VRNLYKVLGIASSADDRRIKSAFRQRAMAVHPDLNPDTGGAEERFRELMQAYQVLRDARARAAYDAHLAQQRRESRRRFAQSAGTMAATFVLTMVSGFFVMGVQGIGVHSQTWQIATAWLTSVEVDAPMLGAVDRSGGTPFTTTVVATTSPESRRHPVTDERPSSGPAKAPASVRSAKAESEAAAKAPRRVVAAAPRTGPIAGDPANPENWWSWPATDEQPYYGLGASGLK
jgi:curved DNA-binding protein CbpA